MAPSPRDQHDPAAAEIDTHVAWRAASGDAELSGLHDDGEIPDIEIILDRVYRAARPDGAEDIEAVVEALKRTEAAPEPAPIEVLAEPAVEAKAAEPAINNITPPRERVATRKRRRRRTQAGAKPRATAQSERKRRLVAAVGPAITLLALLLWALAAALGGR